MALVVDSVHLRPIPSAARAYILVPCTRLDLQNVGLLVMEEVAEVLRPENFEKRRGKAAGVAEGVAEMRTMSMDASTPGVKDLKMEGVHVKHKYAGPMECNIVVHYGGEGACHCPGILVPTARGEVWVGCIATAETFRCSRPDSAGQLNLPGVWLHAPLSLRRHG